jgi:ureidoglycolate hydrolase
MSSGHDLKATIKHDRFNEFSKVIVAFNKRTDKINSGLKKKKYHRVSRYPIGEDVKKGTVLVCVEIQDRSKVLFQELTEIINRFRVKPVEKELAVPPMNPPLQFGVWIPCSSEADAVVLARTLALSGARVESK